MRIKVKFVEGQVNVYLSDKKGEVMHWSKMFDQYGRNSIKKLIEIIEYELYGAFHNKIEYLDYGVIIYPDYKNKTIDCILADIYRSVYILKKIINILEEDKEKLKKEYIIEKVKEQYKDEKDVIIED